MLTDWIVLNSVPGLGPVRIRQLLDVYGTPRAVLEQPAADIARAAGISRDAAARLRDTSALDEARRQVDSAAAAGAAILTLDEPDYPQLLREIFAPPPVLFVKGNREAFGRQAVGVVGTRVPTAYGTRIARDISRQLAQAGLAVVSGLAHGIDTAAHSACLDGGAPTVAVLGTGIERVYPASNRRLADQICETGVLVSEFPIGSQPLRHHFPRRNRIISGLSAGVLVVEAGRRSGALITASYALQQNRDVFAVPGPVTSDKSEGTFNLIRAGATPVRCGADIVEALRMVRLTMAAPGAVSAQFPEELLSEHEQRIYRVLSDAPTRFDQIAAASEVDTTELLDLLLNLELKGAVRQVAGQQYVRT